jgi:uncharacterized protein YggE
MAGACGPVGASPVPEAAPVSAQGRAGESADTTSLTVSGFAEVEVPADRVRLRFAVETQATSAEVAASQNAETMRAVLERVRSEVGPDDRVETSGYRLSPRYRPSNDREAGPEIVGYQAQNAVVVVLTDVDAVGSVLDAALEAGANRVADLSFFASDTEDARLEALREATARARREAEAIAESLGMTLGPPLTVQTSGGNRPSPIAMRGEAAMMAMDTPIEAGSDSVSAGVTITYRLLGGGP